MQVKKKIKKELKLLTLIGPIANCSFKEECPKFKLSLKRALDSGPSLDASLKENKKRIQTSHIPRASYQLQLQGRM
jgi:hypothetical protein